MLRLRPRDQHVWRYAEFQSKKFLRSGDVLDGLAPQALIDHRLESYRLFIGELALAIGVDFRLWDVEHMTEQQRSVRAAAHRNLIRLIQDGRSPRDGVSNRHRAAKDASH